MQAWAQVLHLQLARGGCTLAAGCPTGEAWVSFLAPKWGRGTPSGARRKSWQKHLPKLCLANSSGNYLGGEVPPPPPPILQSLLLLWVWFGGYITSYSKWFRRYWSSQPNCDATKFSRVLNQKGRGIFGGHLTQCSANHLLSIFFFFCLI